MSNLANQNNFVSFVYLGKKLPDYANASLDLAIKYSGLNINFLGNYSIKKQIFNKSILFQPIEEFYSPELFLEVSKKSQMPQAFRDGFWLKTLERFFVLHQYMKSFELKNIFHSELDQLLFNCNLLVDRIEATKVQGIFAPLQNPNKVIASIFYCNDFGSLDSFINYSSSVNTFENEMYLLADWARQNKEKFFALPSFEHEKFKSNNTSFVEMNSIESSKIGGFVDAALLGQWVGGQDPRNLRFQQIPKTKYAEKELNRFHVSRLFDTSISFNGKSLYFFDSDSKEVRLIYNVHLHSKIHKWLIKKESNLIFVFGKLLALKHSGRVPSARKIQIMYLIGTAFKSFKNRIQIKLFKQ